MSAVDKLIAFILSLTPEQVEILLNHVEELSSLLKESSPPCLPEQSAQNQ